MRITFAILTLCLSSDAVAKALSPSNANQYCMYAIYESFASFERKNVSNSTSAVSGSSARSSSASQCTNMLEVTSIYASMREYCHGRAYTAGLDFWKSFCANAGAALMSLDDIKARATTEYINQLPVFNPGAASSATISSAVLLNNSYYRQALRSVTANETDNSRSLNTVWGIHGFWGLVTLVGIIFNLLTRFSYCLYDVPKKDEEKPGSRSRLGLLSASNPISKVYTAANTHFILAPSLGTHHQRLLYGLKIPLRWQASAIFAFWALAFILACIRYDAYSDDPFNGTLAYQIWDTMGPRSGFLAFACLPWLWIFAGRNSIFIWGTGWSFHTFNIFHRHLAIVTVLFAIIHSISYTVKYLAYNPSKYTTDLETDWFKFGIVATGLMSIMIPFSCAALRQQFYEVFLIVHVLFGIVIIYALFTHMSKFGAEYTPHLWPLVAIWSFDRVLRLLRLAVCNLHIMRSSRMHSGRRTTVTYYPSSDVLHIEIQPAALPTSPKPGHYYYLYQPATFRGWENHPFTMASVRCSDNENSPASAFPDSSAPFRTPTEKEAAVVSQPLPLTLQSLTSSTPTLSFWVRPYTGWTQRLRSQALAAGNTLHATILLEGPYGHSACTALRTFDRVIMIMGGTGIGVATAYLQVLRPSRNGFEHPQIELHWTVREPALVSELCRAELSPYFQDPGVQMRFYCSRGLCSSVLEGENALISGVTLEDGRAPIGQIVAQAAAEEGSVAVVVCGPAEMADVSRAAVGAARRGGASGIEYFEEAYGW